MIAGTTDLHVGAFIKIVEGKDSKTAPSRDGRTTTGYGARA